jgi:two-component system, NtrC family, nitrogen regulation response regulator GlnG
VGAPRFVETTRKPGTPLPARGASAEPVLVLAHHPALRRVGELLSLRDRVTQVARLVGELDTGPLDDPFISRQPIELHRTAASTFTIANPHGVDVAIAGVPLAANATREVAVAGGIDIVLGGRIVLWLTASHRRVAGDDLGLTGGSTVMHALRAEIREAAALPGPVLVTGETGTGKELVARALHACSPRARAPFVAVNVAAIPAAVAAAELFGHEKGAFTGATERRPGYFERAAGGTLFLDEIGDLSDAIQPMLLRALDQREIQPLGGTPHPIDAFVVAATDADLTAAVSANRFRGPLYYRLAATTIAVPPLRERGADIAVLLARCLLDVLPAELADTTLEPSPWLPAALVAELLHARWPGNVRQLRAVAQRLATFARQHRIPTLAELGLDDPDDEPLPPSTEPITDDRLVGALREHAFHLSRTAEALGISRTHLDALIAKSARVRKAKDVSREEIQACAAELAGDIDAMAARLEVSPRGLRLRMRAMGTV